MNLRWAWDPQTRDLFRWVDPDAWDASGHDPVRLLGLVSPERLAALAADDGFLRFLAEARDELERYLDGPRWFQHGPGRDLAARPGRLLLARVRHRRGPPAVLGRARRAGRRPPEGRQRPGRAALGDRALLPARLLPPGAQQRRLAAGGLPEPRPVRHGAHPVRRRARPRSSWADPARGPGVAGRRGPGAAVPARHRHRRERRRDARHHRPPLRRRHRAPAPPGDPARHRRRAGPRGPRHRHPGVPHQRGPRRASSASSASVG